MTHPNKKKYPIGSVWQQRDGGLCIVTGHFFNTNNNPFSTALRFCRDTKSAEDYFTFFEDGCYISGGNLQDLIKKVSLDPFDWVSRVGATLIRKRKSQWTK